MPQETPGDERTALDTVLAADAERLRLLQEEAALLRRGLALTIKPLQWPNPAETLLTLLSPANPAKACQGYRFCVALLWPLARILQFCDPANL